MFPTTSQMMKAGTRISYQFRISSSILVHSHSMVSRFWIKKLNSQIKLLYSQWIVNYWATNRKMAFTTVEIYQHILFPYTNSINHEYTHIIHVWLSLIWWIQSQQHLIPTIPAELNQEQFISNRLITDGWRQKSPKTKTIKPLRGKSIDLTIWDTNT